jgi:ATPase subunit of ABC transporter with duplicated ATPase domains
MWTRATPTICMRRSRSELAPDYGTFIWAEKANIGHYPQDQSIVLESDLEVFVWMKQWSREYDASYDDYLLAKGAG